jgi:hypothetical protein
MHAATGTTGREGQGLRAHRGAHAPSKLAHTGTCIQQTTVMRTHIAQYKRVSTDTQTHTARRGAMVPEGGTTLIGTRRAAPGHTAAHLPTPTLAIPGTAPHTAHLHAICVAATVTDRAIREIRGAVTKQNGATGAACLPGPVVVPFVCVCVLRSAEVCDGKHVRIFCMCCHGEGRSSGPPFLRV